MFPVYYSAKIFVLKKIILDGALNPQTLPIIYAYEHDNVYGAVIMANIKITKAISVSE